MSDTERRRLSPGGIHSNSKWKCTRRPWMQEHLHRLIHIMRQAVLISFFFLFETFHISADSDGCCQSHGRCLLYLHTVIIGGANVTETYIPFKNRTLWNRISPEELAGLVSKQDGDSAASTQVLSHYGDFGAPRLWAPIGGQTRDCGRLNPDAEKQRLREMISKTRKKRD